MPFKPHIATAHRLWKEIVKADDLVIDATCGNGHDSLVLVNLVPSGKLYAIDIQEEALRKTRLKLPVEMLNRVHFVQKCHSEFPREIKEGTVRLIVYNLGYLPTGDKSITTKLESTLQSLSAALRLLCKGGMISITLYPGHTEGMREEKALFNFVRELDNNIWKWEHHRWSERDTAPSLLIITNVA